MGEYRQQNRQLKVTTPLGPDVLLLKSFTATDSISRLFSFQLEMLAENRERVPFDQLIGQKLDVELRLPDETTHTFNGLCVQVAQCERDATFTTYFAELVPDVWRLTRTRRSRIFQQMSVTDILRKVLEGIDVSHQIHGTFEPRDYCVQYRETDFAFASRLMEEEGIYYFHTHSAGSHQLVLANTPGDHPELPGEASFRFEELAGGVRDENRIWGWRKEQAWRSGKVTVWDHSFELPHKHLEAEEMIQADAKVGEESHALKVAGNDAFELYDWPGEYAKGFDGVDKAGGEKPDVLLGVFQENRRTARIRMEEETVPSVTIRGKSNIKNLMAGFRFGLERHFGGDGPYVLTSVTQSASFGADYRAGKEALLTYENGFTALPTSIPFRPRRATPRPVVPGSQTAVVVGPKGEEIFTDKYGRVKVQFHWDRDGKGDESSSCWIRVGQLVAGRRWGASFWPRVGQEVIVDFLEGDPDQPIIVGSVYNADQMPPYLGAGPDARHRNDNRVMGIKSNSTTGGAGFNELRFDDTRDAEQVFIHAEKDLDARVKNDLRVRVLRDSHVTIGGGEDGHDGEKMVGDSIQLVHRDRHVTIRRSSEERVEGSLALLVGEGQGAGDGCVDLRIQNDRREMLGGSEHLVLGRDQRESVAGDASLLLGGSRNERIGASWAVEVGEEIHVKAGKKIVFEVGSGFAIKGPGFFMDFSSEEVLLQGAKFKVNCGGSPAAGLGCSPAVPEEAREANPKEPDAADDAKTGQKSVHTGG